MNVKTIVISLLMIGCLLGFAQDSLEEAIAGADPNALITALNEKGDHYQVTPEQLQQMCDKPDMLAAAVAWIYGHRTLTQPLTPVGKPKPETSPIVETRSEPVVAAKPARTNVSSEPARAPGRSLQGDRIMVALDSLYRAELQEGNSKLESRYEALGRLLETIFDHENLMSSDQYIKNYGNERLPEWVAALMDKAHANGPKALPQLHFDIDKKLTFNLTARDLGVKVYVSLFMLHNTPDDVEHFELRKELITPHEKYALTYNAEKDDFELTMIGKPGRNMLRLNKEIGNDVAGLYPGKWGFRLRFTTGRNQLRSDQVHYFEVEAGKAYNLELKRGEQTGTVAMKVTPRQ